MTERSNCSSNVIIRNPNLRRRFETHKVPTAPPETEEGNRHISILQEQGSVGTPRTSDYMRAKSIANAILATTQVGTQRATAGCHALKMSPVLGLWGRDSNGSFCSTVSLLTDRNKSKMNQIP